MIQAIFAIGNRGEFGFKNKIPWNCPSDLKRFQRLTLNQKVVMGSNTAQSLKDYGVFPLKRRENIVVSRNDSSLDEALEDSPIIIGGLTLITTLLEQSLIDRVYLSRISASVEADCFINPFPYLAGFNLEEESYHFEQGDQYAHWFQIWTKPKNKL